MEITIDTVISLLGLFIGGGGGAFFTWEDKQKEVDDNHRLIAELREDRDHYKQGYVEMRNRQDKTEEMVRDLQMQVARNGRMVESMRPFLCYDMKCKKRVRVQVSECEAAEIEPINHEDL